MDKENVHQDLVHVSMIILLYRIVKENYVSTKMHALINHIVSSSIQKVKMKNCGKQTSERLQRFADTWKMEEPVIDHFVNLSILLLGLSRVFSGSMSGNPL